MKNGDVEVLKVTQADENHQVWSIRTGAGPMAHQRKPCRNCPWRRDAVGEFPAEAFKLSAKTAYDMAKETFCCHSAGPGKPSVCAGFLLRGADDNFSVRMAYLSGRLTQDFHENGHELFDSYREMAIANGVDPEDPVLKLCRD